MINKLAILSIEGYQRYLSPHKGYCCAYSHFTGKKSCSEFTKLCIQKYGLFKTLPLFKAHIDKCKIIYIAEEHKAKEKKIDMCNELAGICACV